MPGVPREMKPMFVTDVAPLARTLVSEGIHQVRIKTFGMPESAVNDRLDGIEAAHGVVIGYRAHFPEIEVKVLARAKAPAEAARISRAAANEVLSRLGDAVYAEGDVDFAQAVGSLFRERSLSFATAESCTGGLVASLLTDHAGASDFFRGSIVAYDNSVKAGALGVSAALLSNKGAVSGEVARSMAEGASRALGADVALGVTGIAGPGGCYPGETRRASFTSPLRLPTARPIATSCFRERDTKFVSAAAYAGLSLARRVVLHGHGSDQLSERFPRIHRLSAFRKWHTPP